MVLTKVVHPLKICQHTKYRRPSLTGSSFASMSEVLSVCRFLIVEDVGLKIWH
jgi:hypothetical protein